MGFPSPATDYQENRLSLDQHCNTGAPGVFFFRSDTYDKAWCAAHSRFWGHAR